jgi:hypothetical protein
VKWAPEGASRFFCRLAVVRMRQDSGDHLILKLYRVDDFAGTIDFNDLVVQLGFTSAYGNGWLI